MWALFLDVMRGANIYIYIYYFFLNNRYCSVFVLTIPSHDSNVGVCVCVFFFSVIIAMINTWRGLEDVSK